MSLSQSKEIAAPVADDVTPAHAEAHAGAHAVPRRILLGVYGALVMFTIITVGVSRLDLGPANIWVALIVAVIKGGLVVMYFMHLRWDSPFNGLILVSALFFVAVFIGIAMLDAHSYEVNKQLPQSIILPDKNDTTLPPGETPADDTGPTIASMMPNKDVKVPTGALRAQILEQVTATHGDPLEGEKLFADLRLNCITCHTVRKVDPLKCPCLADIGKKYSRKDLAENIIDPSMKIAEGFETWHYKLNDEIPMPVGPASDTVEGFRVKMTADKVTLRLITGKYVTFDVSNIAKPPKMVPTSPMPEGVVGPLTIRQFASILDYLQALSGVK